MISSHPDINLSREDNRKTQLTSQIFFSFSLCFFSENYISFCFEDIIFSVVASSFQVTFTMSISEFCSKGKTEQHRTPKESKNLPEPKCKCTPIRKPNQSRPIQSKTLQEKPKARAEI